MTTRDRLHRLVDALPVAELDTAGRVLKALAIVQHGVARSVTAHNGEHEAGESSDCVLSVADACALLGIARSGFYRDPVWPTLLDRPSPGRVGLRRCVLLAELDRRQKQGNTTTPRPLRAPSARAAPVPSEAPARPYVRRRRAGNVV